MATSSLFAGVSGLRSYQDMLNVVGNNLANTNTDGFKSQRVRFADLLYQTISQATSGTSNRVGGTNPLQVGFGVKSQAIDQNFAQGSLETTGGDLDLAIQGNGFFVVNNGVQDLFTRSGAFAVDENGFMVDPATGFHVQRFGTVGEPNGSGAPSFQVVGDSSIRIPFGSGIPGNTSTNVVLEGNLSANALGPLAQTLTSSQPFKVTGTNAPADLTTPINSLADSSGNYVAGDVIRIQGTTVGGTAVDTTLTLSGGPPPTTTLGDLINAINAAYPGSTASLDANGNLILKANYTGPANQLSLVLSDGATNTGLTSWTNHSLAVTTVGKDGDVVTTAIQIFDSQGTGHTLSLVFQKVANDTWNLTGSVPSNEGTVIDGQVNGLVFNDDGSFRQVTGTGAGDQFMTFQFNGISKPQTISFNFGTPNGFNGLTQFGGNSSAAAIRQDGFAAGFLSSLSVGKDGIINGVFTNGRTLSIAQLALATFQNVAGLNRLGDTYFALSTHSGGALIGPGNSGGHGSVQQGALEASNVDVAQEFTQLIVAQRGFQVNARTITVSDQVLQELANIIR